MSDDLRADIFSAIQAGQADLFLQDIMEAVVERREALGRELLRTIRPGTRVVTTGPLEKALRGFTGAVEGVHGERISVLFDKGQYVGRKYQKAVDAGRPMPIPATCLRVLADQTPPTIREPRVVNGATIYEVPFEFDAAPLRRRNSRRG